MSPIVVPDASVLVKWVLASTEEPDRDAALQLRLAWLEERIEVLLPSIWFFEVGSVVSRREPSSAQAVMRALMALRFAEASPAVYVDRALALVRAHEVTFYDASYHAVALESGGTFVTADTRYARRTTKAGAICLLTDWRAPGASGPSTR